MALITPSEVSTLARPIYTNPDIVERLIDEAESIDIRKQLGDGLFLALQGAPTAPQYITLLQGGAYAYNGSNYVCEGIKRALAYYVYARIIRDGNIQATEYGSVIKEDENSSKAQADERRRHYGEVFATADQLMQTILLYLNRCSALFPEFRAGTPQRNPRGGFRVLDSSHRTSATKPDTIIIAGEKGDKGDPGISANPSIVTKGIYNRYLYDVLMTDVDYNYAKAHIAELAHTAGACTSFRRGTSVGRNFDWTFNNDAEFVVRTAGVIGVAHMPGLTAEMAAKGTWQQDERTAKLLPFMLADGVNSHGVFASVHVVDKGAEMYDIPGREDLPALMLVRYILDNFNTAEEAVAYIKSATSVTMPADLLAKGQELQWFVADSTSSYVLENIDGVLDYSERDILTNFHWHGVTRNPDGTLYGPERPEGINPTEENGLTPYATGIERYNIVVGATGAEVAEVLDRVKYSHLYENAEGIWFSELVGGELTIDAEPETFAVRLADARNAWAARNRETGRVWHSMHSCVYDLDAKTISIVTQDGDSSIDKTPTNVALIGFDLEDVINEAQGAVKYNRQQILTEPQKAQARQNIGAINTEQMAQAVLVEKQRAEAKEAQLQEAITAEANTARGYENQLYTKILQGEDRAKLAELQLQAAIDRESSRASNAERDLHNEILAENTRAVDTEFELSKRIDAIVQGRNVRDIVPNYQALLDYDTSTLGDNDIIMVLLDNTKSDHTTYYRWKLAEQSWEFIGGLAFTYTKTEIDEKFAALHIVLPTFNEHSSQEVLAQVDETIRHAGADASFKVAIPIEGMQGNVTVTYVKYNPMHTYLGVFADDRSELYHITRTLTTPRTYTCEVITKVFATADALASLIKDLYNADPAEGEEKGDIVKLREGQEALAERIEDIERGETPNVSVFGSPRFDHGQVSGFSRENYLAMPFHFNVQNQRFELTLAFVMGADVNTPQNILGSAFSLAMYVQNGKLNVRVSSNGTDWNIISWEYSDKTLVANHPYFVRLAFDGINYAVKFSENGKDYTTIYNKGANQFPFARLLYLGIGNNFNNPFLGTINLNKCSLTIAGETFWEGMTAGGVPEAPEDGNTYGRKNGSWAKTASEELVRALQEDVNRLFSDFAEYDKTDFPDVVFGTPTREGAYIGESGQFVASSDYNVSNEIAVTKGSLYKLYVGNEATLPIGIAVFSKVSVITTPSGEKKVYTPQFVSAGGATPKSGYLVFLATEDMTIVTSYPTSATKLEVVRYGVLASLCTQIDVLRKAVDLKSFADGYYAQMRVGLADNLTPRGEAVDAEFTERVAGGGMSITDGSSKYDEVRGNSLVWNQYNNPSLIDGYSQAGIQYFVVGNVITYVGNSEANYSIMTPLKTRLVDNHKHLFHYENGEHFVMRLYNSEESQYSEVDQNAIVSIGVYNTFLPRISGISGLEINERVAIQVIDLTRMFGAGNEPATYEEFLRRKPEVADEYAYNEGEIVNNKTEGIKTIGINLWDEQWENGVYDLATGNKMENPLRVRCKNMIPVYGNSVLYFNRSNYTAMLCFDINKHLLGPCAYQSLGSGYLNILKEGTAYVVFHMNDSYGTTYKHDICINISNPAINGQYFPYEEKTLDFSWIKDIKSEGATLFPDGLRSAGGVYDVVTATKATKKIGVKIFDGSENWGSTSLQVEGYFTTANTFEQLGMIGAKPLSNNYVSNDDEVFNGGTGGIYFYIRVAKSKATDNTSFKHYLAERYAAGNPFVALYEFAEPIEVSYDEKNMTIPVAAGGMEIAVADEPSTPLKARIIYGMDAYNQIIANKNNIGNPATLATTAKELVGAINELKAEIERLKNQ